MPTYPLLNKWQLSKNISFEDAFEISNSQEIMKPKQYQESKYNNSTVMYPIYKDIYQIKQVYKVITLIRY